MTLTLPAKPRTTTVVAAVDPRPRLQAELALLQQQAQSAATAGDLDQAGKAILAILDCERRLGAFGPQVLQLIKPRN